MTEVFGLFDAADPEAPDRVYTSEAFARLFRTIMRDGIVHNDGDELAVSPTVPAAMSVNVGTGMALVQGRYLINDAALTLAVEAADPSYPRIDRVVVRADLVGRTVHVVVKKGTAAASPVAPTLTRTAEIWELSLAQVRVEAGATSILSAKITDERANTSLCGVAAPAYVPSSQLEVVGAVDMQGKALTGLPVPSAATDAARRNMGGATLQGLGTPSATTDAATKAYVDSATVPKLSALVMDADKNWGGRNITNMGKISPKTWLALVGTDPLLISKSHASSTTVSFAQLDGTGHVKVIVNGSYVVASGTRVFNILKNGVEVWSQSQSSSWGGENNFFPGFTATAFEDLSVTNGDILTISRTGGAGSVTVDIYATPLVAPYGIVT